MTQPIRTRRATLLVLLFAGALIVDMLLPKSAREQSFYRISWDIFAMVAVLYFAYTRRTPAQRHVRTASIGIVAGMLASLAADRVGPGAAGFVLQAVALACFVAAIIVFVAYLRSAARTSRELSSN